MTRNGRTSLLIASALVVVLATTSEACHRRRARTHAPWGNAGHTYASPAGYYGSGGGYYTAAGGYNGGGYAGGMVGDPAGYSGYGGYGGYGAGYGGYGAGYTGRDGSMAGGYLRGRALGAMEAPAGAYGLTRGGVGGGSLMGAAAGYRAAGGR